MTKIEEIVDKYNVHYGTPDSLGYGCFMTIDMISAMKEYAEWYAKQCLEIAAKEACLNEPKLDYSPSISKISITDIQLPDHDSI